MQIWRLDWVAQAFNSSNQEAEADGFLRVRSQLGLQSKFQNNQGYTKNPYIGQPPVPKKILVHVVRVCVCVLLKPGARKAPVILLSLAHHSPEVTVYTTTPPLHEAGHLNSSSPIYWASTLTPLTAPFLPGLLVEGLYFQKIVSNNINKSLMKQWEFFP